eukprot:2194851-Rhodomonas_salina.1
MSATATSAGQVSDCCWNVYEVPTSQRWRFKAQYIKMPDGIHPRVCFVLSGTEQPHAGPRQGARV